MKLVLKIVLSLIVIAVVGFAIMTFIAYNKMVKVTELAINDSDSLATKIEKADKWLLKLHKNNQFNGAVLLIKNDTVILKNTYGYTNHKRTEELTVHSSFRLASVSKQFTAVGIMLLKEQGKLNFDDSITKFLPNLPYKNVTVRNLLNHTSGVPDVYMNFPKKYKSEVGEVLTISKMIELLAKENLPLTFQPNEKFEYNNSGYVLLAGIIEKISGTSFEEFMQSALFDKLNMRNTRVWNLVSKDNNFKNKVSSFENLLGEVNELKLGALDGVAGDGSVFSSIDDFIIWNQFWCNTDLLSDETKKEAFIKPTLNNGKQSDYGFGWIIASPKSHWHNGSWLGARTIIARNEELKNCLVILDNSASMAVDNMSNELAKVLK